MFDKHISREELSRAYSNAISDKVFQEETISGQAKSLGFSLFTSDHLHYDDIYDFKLKNAKPSDVTKSLNDNIDLSSPVISILLPLDSTLTEKDFLDAYNKGVGKYDQIQLTIEGEDYDISDPETIQITKMALKLVYRHDPQLRLFNLSIAEGGQRAENNENCSRYF